MDFKGSSSGSKSIFKPSCASKMKKQNVAFKTTNSSEVISSQHMMQLFLAGKYQECLEFMSKDTRNKNDSKKILMTACWSYLGINYNEAVETLKAIIKKDPKNSYAHYGLGHSFYLKGKLKKCLEPFTRAAELNPMSMARALWYKNISYKILKLINDATTESAAGNFTKGIDILATASKIDPENNAIQKRIKDISNNLMQQFQCSLKKDQMSRDKEEQMNYVNFLIESNQFEEASKAVSYDILSANSWFIRGLINYYSGCLKLSLVEFSNALQIGEDFPEAQKSFRKATKLVELMENASNQMKTKEFNVAVDLLSSALEVDPGNKRICQAIYFQRAFCKYEMKMKDEAFNDYLRFEAFQNQTGMIMEGIKF